LIFLLRVSTAQGNAEYIDKLLQNFSPSEVLIPKNNKKFLELLEDYHSFYLEDWIYKEYIEILTKNILIVSLKGFGIEDLKEGIVASEHFVLPIRNTAHNSTHHLQTYSRRCLRLMDRFTICNLELYQSYNPNAVTLLDVIDKRFRQWRASTERWLALPLKA
jgi:DNA mismatch repair protein MutS